MLRLYQFGDHLSNFSQVSKPLVEYRPDEIGKIQARRLKQDDDNRYWASFVQRFFSASKGVFRHSVWIVDETSNKQYEIPYPALARYFYTHFESGVRNIQMIIERANEKDLPNNGHYVESIKASFVYWFENNSQVCCLGSLGFQHD